MRPRLLTVCVVVGLAASGVQAAQSLAGLAQQEAERRKTIQKPAQVISDKDLRPTPGPAATDASPASPSGDTGSKIESGAVSAARFRGGALPAIPVQAIGGGEVLLELRVNREGRVAAVKVLRDAPPFTEALAAVVGAWQFDPALEDVPARPGEPVESKTRRPIESSVLVVGMFRPPALYGVTLGDPPQDIAPPSGAAPYPASALTMPSYPPLALFDGVVLAELRVGVDGRVPSAAVVRSSPAFDRTALDAIAQWTFRPARVAGRPAETLAYAVLAFRRPVTDGPAPTGLSSFAPASSAASSSATRESGDQNRNADRR